MKKINYLKTLYFIGFVLFFIITNKVIAQSQIGGNITYECLGGDTFKIKLDIIKYCSAALSPPTQNLSINSPCGNFIAQAVLTNPANPPLPWMNAGTQVSQVCASALSQTFCNSGNIPGEVKVTYEAIVYLPPCIYNISYTGTCCYAQNINTNTSNSGIPFFNLYLDNTINCSSGVSFNTKPNPFYCAGQKASYNLCVNEPDGDSLVYTLVSGYNGNINSPKIFSSPYSAQVPIIGLTIDSTTGEINFIPTSNGKFVVVVNIDEYEKKTGLLLSSTMFETMFTINLCSNTQPKDTVIAEWLPGNATQINQNSFEFCNIDSNSFTVKVFDENPNDSLIISSNISQVLPSGNMLMTYAHPNRYDTALVTFFWNKLPTNGGNFSINLMLTDNACPIYGLNIITLNIHIASNIETFGNSTICKNAQQATLNVNKGTHFTWTALPGGDPIIIGAPSIGNFSCDTCKNPLVYPNFNTCYQVISNISATCKNTDTVCVNVVKDFTVGLTNDTLICTNKSIQLQATTSVPGNYSFNWSNAQNLDNASISNPTVTQKQTTNYTVTVTSDSGCSKQASVLINAGPYFPMQNEIIASDSVICMQDTINLQAQLNVNNSFNCGFSTSNNFNYDTIVNVGSGSSFSSLVSPFKNGISAKTQYLLRSSDLLSFGLKAGKITEIAFDITSANPTLIYNIFSIKIGCTSKNQLDNTFEENLHQVFTPKPVFPTFGWFHLPFDGFYEWDGVSNLIIEVCYNNSMILPGNGFEARNTSTSYKATLTSNYLNGMVACTQTKVHSSGNELPIFKIKNYYGLNQQNYTVTWLNMPNLMPGFNINQFNIEAIVNQTTQNNFVVAIADTFGLCTDTISKNIQVVTQFPVSISADSVYCNVSEHKILTASTNGLWSGAGIIDDSLGIFDPSVAGLGTHSITFYTANGSSLCANFDSVLIEVINPPSTALPNFTKLCRADTAAQIMGANGYFSSVNPLFSQTIVDSAGIFNLTLLPSSIDSFFITYLVSNSACTVSEEFKVPLYNPFNPQIIKPSGFCPDANQVQFTATQSGGLWSGTGVLNSLLGTFTLAGLQEGDSLTVTIDSTGFCGGTISETFTIDTLTEIYFTFQQGNNGPYCKNDSTTVVFEGNPINDPNVFGSGFFNHQNNWITLSAFNTSNISPSPGIYQSVYTFTNLLGCTSSDSIQFVIYPEKPAPNLVYDSLSNQLITIGFLGQNLTYKWLKGGVHLTQFSASDSIITPPSGGNYAVEVTSDCGVGVSSNVLIHYVGINETIPSEISVYPNPNNGIFTLDFGNQNFDNHIQIVSPLGQVYRDIEVKEQSKILIEDLPKGVWLIVLEKNVRRIIVQ